jgi:hypothetical protein
VQTAASYAGNLNGFFFCQKNPFILRAPRKPLGGPLYRAFFGPKHGPPVSPRARENGRLLASRGAKNGGARAKTGARRAGGPRVFPRGSPRGHLKGSREPRAWRRPAIPAAQMTRWIHNGWIFGRMLFSLCCLGFRGGFISRIHGVFGPMVWRSSSYRPKKHLL